MRVVINGKEVLRANDPNPLPVSRLGIGGYRTHANFSFIEVRRLTPPPKAKSGS